MSNVLYGVDISHANPETDLHSLVSAGNLSFFFLKATEGVNFIDSTFVDRFKRIKTYLPSVRLGVYHFLRIDSPVEAQMDHFHSVIKSAGFSPGCIIPVIDAETGLHGETPSGEMVQKALDYYEKTYGVLPGVYSGLAYFQEHLSNIRCSFKWVAAYRSVKPDYSLDIWQDSESKSIAGHAYDHNIYYGTQADFDTKFLIK